MECADLIGCVEYSTDQVESVHFLFCSSHIYVVDVLVEWVSVPAGDFDLAGVCVQVVRGDVVVLIQVLQGIEVVELANFFNICFNLIFSSFTILSVITRSYVEEISTKKLEIHS